MNNMKQRTVIPEGKKTSGEPHHCLSSLPGESFEATVQGGETELEPNGLLGWRHRVENYRKPRQLKTDGQNTKE